MIQDYEALVELGIYPSKKEWFSKYSKHGKDTTLLLEHKKQSLKSIPLKTIEGSLYFNEAYIAKILKDYYSMQAIGLESDRHFSEVFEEILIFSEVEGTLEIEGIKTSKKKIEDILTKTNLTPDEQVVFNMRKGIDYITTHEITEPHLHELYEILSKDCLNQDQKLEDGFYRKKDVDIIDKYGLVSDRGVDSKNLDSWMNEFIHFIQNQLNSLNELTYLLPHLVHYYMILLHPYYDFNGRMGRMLSYWVILKSPYLKDKIPVFSEAINYNPKTKALYYRAIESSRADDNDLTYFFETMFLLGKKFIALYIRLDEIETQSRRQGKVLTQNEINTLKSILLYIKDKAFFSWEDVSFVDKQQFSKQYYLRLLNSITEKEVLTKTMSGKAAQYRLK
jgi:Fic family protein